MKKLKEKAKKLKTDIPAVFLALKDRKTPWYVKMLAAVIVVYALSPVDLIPDFIPVLGYLDDVIILPALIALCVKLIPTEVFDDYRARATKMWGEEKQGKWYFAIPFVLIWLAIVLLIVFMFI